MRDYLYIWNDPEEHFIVASGIEFSDLVGQVGSEGGLVLLEHRVDWDFDYVKQDWEMNFSTVPLSGIGELAKEHINLWGNFSWADYAGESIAELSDQEIAELLFFAHMKRPLDRIALPALGNKFLCCIHDDGWHMKLYYSTWDDVAVLLGALHPELNLTELHTGKSAYWVSGSSIDIEEKTFDIDSILERRIDHHFVFEADDDEEAELAPEQVIRDVTLMLIYLTSWTEKKSEERRAWKYYDTGVLNELKERNLICGDFTAPLTSLTEEGEKLARELLEEYGNRWQ